MNREALTYRTFIQQEFERRRRKNSRYSLRSLARDLEIPAPKLCQALRGSRGISSSRALVLARKMNLSSTETELFVSMVESEHGRSQTSKLRAQEKVQALQASLGFDDLSMERFQIIRDWYYFAILELTELKSFKAEPSWIAKRLKISKSEVKNAIQALLDFGLLREDPQKGYVQTHIDLAVGTGLPSRDLREHHSQILQKGDQALQEIPVEQRDFSAITMAVDSSQLLEARQWIKEFRRRFCKDLQKKPDKNRVYCLAIQFFPLDQEDNEILKEAKT
jgi:uncharacterized protein (TIGR02147 family)